MPPLLLRILDRGAKIFSRCSRGVTILIPFLNLYFRKADLTIFHVPIYLVALSANMFATRFSPSIDSRSGAMLASSSLGHGAFFALAATLTGILDAADRTRGVYADPIC